MAKKPAAKVSQKQIGRVVKRVAPAKRLGKQVKTIRSNLKKEVKRNNKQSSRIAKVSKKTATLDAELDKLRKDMQKLSQRKTPKKQLNEYNLFMRRQLNEGKTFAQSVKLWKRLKAVEAGKMPTKTKTRTITKTVVRKVSDPKQKAELSRLQKELDKLSKRKASKKQLNEYNLFMRRQLNEGKTFAQAVKIWKQVKRVEEGKLPTKTKTRTVTKTVVKRLKAKPVVKYRTRVKQIVKEKPVIKYQTKIEKVTDPELERSINEKETQLARLESEKERLRMQADSELESLRHKNQMDIASLRQKFDLELLAERQKLDAERRDLEKRMSEETTRLKGDLALAQQVAQSPEVRLARISHGTASASPEQVAHYVLRVFFGEITHVGFKRRLSLDDVLNAYFYSLAQVSQRMGKPVLNAMSDEEASYHVVHLYFHEVASHRIKRRMDLDEVMNAYFYVLDKMLNKAQLLSNAQAQLSQSNQSPPKQ